MSEAWLHSKNVNLWLLWLFSLMAILFYSTYNCKLAYLWDTEKSLYNAFSDRKIKDKYYFYLLVQLEPEWAVREHDSLCKHVRVMAPILYIFSCCTEMRAEPGSLHLLRSRQVRIWHRCLIGYRFSKELPFYLNTCI